MKSIVSRASLIFLAYGLTACQLMTPKPPMMSVGMTGIDHLADHLSVQDYWVNGQPGFQAGKGGRNVCCARLPEKWSPDSKIEVSWEVANWKRGTWRCFRRWITIEPYTQSGHLNVHFLPDGTVKAVVSNEAPWGPIYDGPRIPIPRKEPWKQYPAPPVTKDCPENKEASDD